MTAFISHLSYDVRTGLRDRTLMLMNYLFPLFFFALMGALMGGINPTFKDNMVPAMIAVGIMTNTLLGMPGPAVAAREAGIYRSYKINGVPALAIITIPVVSSLLHIAIVSGIITAAASPLFGGRLPGDWGYFILVALLSGLAMSGAGMLIGVAASGARSTVLLAQLIFLPSMMLGGLMFPANLLPPALFRLSLLLPASHAMNAWKALAYGDAAAFNPYLSLAVLAAGALAAFGLAAFLFRWDSHSENRKKPVLLALLALTPYVLSMLLA